MSSIPQRSLAGFAATGFACALLGLAPAQPPPLPQQDDRQNPAKPQQAPPSTLDDLLGLDEPEAPPQAPSAEGEAPAAQPGGDEAAQREHEEALKQRFDEAQVVHTFVAAVQKMSLSAELLDRKFDTGVGTQRVQEDIIAKLQQLLDQAQRLQRMSQSSSASSSSSRATQQPQRPQNPGQQRQPQRRPGEQNPGNNRQGENRGEIDPPPMQQGELQTQMSESRSEWGALPQRTRDSLLQGRSDKFSTLYEQLTREYYKRLAEEGSP